MNILKKIASPFVSAYKWVAKLFSDAMDAARKYSPVAVQVTARLKEIVESPIAGIVVDLIPGNTDNAILAVLRKVIPEVATKMAITHRIIHESETNADAVGGIVEYLKSLHPDARIGFWITFAGELNIALADNKITIDEAVILTQMAYKELFGKK